MGATQASQGDCDGERDSSAGVRYQPLVVVLVAAAAGIVADRYGPAPVFRWWAAAAAALACWFPLWRRGRETPAAVLLLAAVAATAASWHHCCWFLFAEDDLGYYARRDAQPVCVEAIALKSARMIPPPEVDPLRAVPIGERWRVDVELRGIRDRARWKRASGRARLLVEGRLPEDVKAGDRLRVFAQFLLPSPADNPGEFDYARYLRAERQRSVMRTAFTECVSVVPRGHGWSVRRLIERARDHGNRLLQQHLDQRRWPLAASVLLGAREWLDPEQKQAFMETGTVHLLAISGLHVGILAGLLLGALRRAPMPRGWAMLVVAGLSVSYMLLTDARPPVVRATILVLVICLSLWLRRRPLSFNSLSAAALIVLAWSPAELFHTGFQLSFLAVATLMWFGPRWTRSRPDQDPLDRLTADSGGWLVQGARWSGRRLRHLMLASAAIWLVTLPLVMARFHLVVPIAPLLNTLVWLPMTAGLIAGFATMVFGTFAAPLGHVFGRCADASFWCLQSSVEYGQQIPGGHLWVPGPADWWLTGFYGGLTLLAASPRLRPPRRWCLALLAGWTAVGFAASAMRHDNRRLDCTFLSMGHGCAVVLELPSGQTILYDAGRFGAPNKATRSIAGYLWSRGITHLDAVILSHADLDHYSGLPGLLERFSVGVVYVSPVMFDGSSPALLELRESIHRSGVPLREIHRGDRLDSETCHIGVLHPPRSGVLGGDNPNSIVLDVEYLGRRILLPGDLDRPGLQDVLAEQPTHYDVLMAPHHGSRSSNPPGLAEWSTPRWVVVSGTHRWGPGLIETTYQAAGSQVLHTADAGAIRISMTPGGVGVDGFHVGPIHVDPLAKQESDLPLGGERLGRENRE